MNLKQAAGMMLLFIMIITAYGLFGGSENIKHNILPETTNLSENVPEISAYGGYTFEEQASVDIGAICIIIVLIIITALGSLPPAKVYAEKGTEAELLEGEDKQW